MAGFPSPQVRPTRERPYAKTISTPERTLRRLCADSRRRQQVDTRAYPIRRPGAAVILPFACIMPVAFRIGPECISICVNEFTRPHWCGNYAIASEKCRHSAGKLGSDAEEMPVSSRRSQRWRMCRRPPGGRPAGGKLSRLLSVSPRLSYQAVTDACLELRLGKSQVYELLRRYRADPRPTSRGSGPRRCAKGYGSARP